MITLLLVLRSSKCIKHHPKLTLKLKNQFRKGKIVEMEERREIIADQWNVVSSLLKGKEQFCNWLSTGRTLIYLQIRTLYTPDEMYTPQQMKPSLLKFSPSVHNYFPLSMNIRW